MSSTPRESVEWRPVEVKANDQVLTAGVEVCITPRGARPTTWDLAVLKDGKTCVRVAGLSPGYYWVWGRGTIGTEQGVVGPFELPIS